LFASNRSRSFLTSATRFSMLVDQSVWSKARRAATIAASTSAAEASAARPTVSPVQGPMTSKVLPPSASRSSPSMNSFASGRLVMVIVFLSNFDTGQRF
jgi:hypothetical protein